MSERKTQLERIADMLEHDGQIDNFYCMNTRLTLRLAMHIGVLRGRGWKIRTEELSNKNCVYHLMAMPAAKQLTLV